MRSNKYLRQQIMHDRVMRKIRRNGLRVDTPELREHLEWTGTQVAGLNHEYVEIWRSLLSGNDLDRIDMMVSGDGDIEGEMRNLSPLPMLLSPDERMSVLQDAVAVEQSL
ncbi:hypothetical protein AAFP30_21640 [Gordonia sp. CPCC 205515]|uniref:hypothetical protein n=1 Tax=Gordonia sp. CPCC 205515 TaxID=3140791 RepID=UPI003AF3D03A